jgi:hypothetical protein
MSLGPQTASSATDVVCILDKDLRQVLETARPIKAGVKPSAKLMEHPLETGATIVDFRIVNPLTIELSLLLATEEYQAVYKQIQDLFTRAVLLTVQTRAGSFSNMLISSMPHEEDAGMMDAIPVAVSLQEVQLVDTLYTNVAPVKPRNPTDSKTVKRGEQQPKESEQNSSLLGRVGRWASS